MKETQIMRLIQKAASSIGYRVFRNNVGLAWTGQIVRKEAGTVTLKNAIPIKYGLCNGSADLIGWKPKVILPEDVGKTVAVFTAIEVKSETGTLRPEQEAFIDAVGISGGVAIVARSTEDLI